MVTGEPAGCTHPTRRNGVASLKRLRRGDRAGEWFGGDWPVRSSCLAESGSTTEPRSGSEAEGGHHAVDLDFAFNESPEKSKQQKDRKERSKQQEINTNEEPFIRERYAYHAAGAKQRVSATLPCAGTARVFTGGLKGRDNALPCAYAAMRASTRFIASTCRRRFRRDSHSLR